MRDEVIDTIHRYHERTEIRKLQLVDWIGMSRGKCYDWSQRYGCENRHNGRIPRSGLKTDTSQMTPIFSHWQELSEGIAQLFRGQINATSG